METLHIGCLADGRTVYIMPAGAVDLRWLVSQFPEVNLQRNLEANRDELQYSELSYRTFLDFLRREGWEAFSAAAGGANETLNFMRSPRLKGTKPLAPM